jgi:hypothetical protein
LLYQLSYFGVVAGGKITSVGIGLKRVEDNKAKKNQKPRKAAPVRQTKSGELNGRTSGSVKQEKTNLKFPAFMLS